MPRFFVDCADGDTISIYGDDARHIGRSLRMRVGEQLTVCDGRGTDCTCVIDSMTDEEVLLQVLSRTPGESEPDVKVTLYQGYPKGDKLETVIEKAVELGAFAIVPVLTERSVARPDSKSAEKKHQRWQRHALEAAKQCGRSIIPQVEPLAKMEDMPSLLSRHELCIFCYELGGQPLTEIIGASKARSIAVFIGPEGGISSAEAQMLEASGAIPATLGKRILRTETAPIAAIAAIMCITGNLQ
ncbi:MAG: 16S rRNA (uracil(1498)-N(3))-methyltransferase [Clostridia bacterium]|nr:16S rRNA (uracil(1498)-N(3))-methyltransferase [Clostridia bacterium]